MKLRSNFIKSVKRVQLENENTITKINQKELPRISDLLKTDVKLKNLLLIQEKIEIYDKIRHTKSILNSIMDRKTLILSFLTKINIYVVTRNFIKVFIRFMNCFYCFITF